jgi:hypothetical protein
VVIKTLVENIKQDLYNEFNKEENINLVSAFKGILVKEIYQENPQISYPEITIQEFENSENENYSSNLGEEFSSLGYQINCLAKNTKEMQANEVVRLMGEIVNKVLGENYKMKREGISPIIPLPSDNTILQYSLRYTCVLDILRDNRIYKN